MNQRSDQDLAEGLFHFLGGYVQGCPEPLAQVLRYPYWQERAKAEVERQITQIIASLDLETVAAIAEGRVDVHAVATRLTHQNP